MLLAAAMTRAAYDPETISMLSTVLERAIAALPPPGLGALDECQAGIHSISEIGVRGQFNNSVRL